jgi:hypothetical protein
MPEADINLSAAKKSGLKKAEAQSSSSPGWRPLKFRSIVLTD